MTGRKAPDARVGAELALAWQGEALVLLPERALYWPAARTLIVADVHLGKAAALRRQGVAVPAGSSTTDLQRLSALVTRTVARRLLMLGDLFHAAPRPGEPLMAAFDAFRVRHGGLHIEGVRGNHDRPVAVPAAWRIDWRDEGTLEPPFVWRHTPVPDARGHVVCGHVHPAYTLRAGRERLRLPVFWLGATVSVLPAFGSLTGGHDIRPQPGDQLYGLASGSVLRLPVS